MTVGDETTDGALVEGIVGFDIVVTGALPCVSIIDGALVETVVGFDVALTGTLPSVSTIDGGLVQAIVGSDTTVRVSLSGAGLGALAIKLSSIGSAIGIDAPDPLL